MFGKKKRKTPPPPDGPRAPGCYLLHIDTDQVDANGNPIVKHYKGKAVCVWERIEDHEKTIAHPPPEGSEDTRWEKHGPGAKWMGVVNYHKWPWKVGRIWWGEKFNTREFEKRVRGYHKETICEVCGGPDALKRLKG